MSTFSEGQLFERYRIQRLLGNSVSGESYEAEDTMLLRKVTLKLIHPWATLPDSARRQFFREMQGISILNHPYLAAVLDYGEINSRLYVARRYVTSSTLLGNEGRLWFRPPLNVTDAVRYIHQLAQALQYIHNHGYLNGSLTFSNILVLHGPNLDNEQDYAPFLLADVGLTNFVRRFGQPQNQLFPITAAPEQYGKRVTPASDQFALAVLLYFWLTGRPPYLGTPEEIEHLKLTGTISPPSSFNPMVTLEQEGILLRALSVYPEDRYPSVLAFADSLLATLANEPYSVPASEPIAQPESAAPVSAQLDEEPEPELPPLRAETIQDEAHEPANIVPALSTSTPDEEPEFSSHIEPAPELALEVEAVVESELILQIQLAILAETDPLLFSEPVAQMDEPTQAEPVAESEPATEVEKAIPGSENSAEVEHSTQAEEPIILAENSVEAEPVIQTEATTDVAFAAEDQLAQQIPQPTPEPAPTPQPQPEPTPPPTPAPTPTPEPAPQTIPAPEPTPAPQPEPDIPQPIPQPDVPQPTPNPIPAPQPDIPQTPSEPDVPQPVPDPIPQPAPDVPQPLPEPNVPPTTPQPLPQADHASIGNLADDQEPLTNAQKEQDVTIPRLVITSPYTEQPLEFRLESDQITLGRAGSSDILLDQDNLTSRHHALLRHEDNSYIIYDRRSANGVFVNGQKIDTEIGYELANGDHVSIGNYEIIFRLSPLMNMAFE